MIHSTDREHNSERSNIFSMHYIYKIESLIRLSISIISVLYIRPKQYICTYCQIGLMIAYYIIMCMTGSLQICHPICVHKQYIHFNLYM